MKVLNLTNYGESDIKFRISTFPDGQQDITLISWKFTSNITDIGSNEVIQIKSRFNSFKDLELIICATKALRRLKVKEIHLYIPYLLGARSDRQFLSGGNSYLVDVIAPILNAQDYESVTVMDAHSDVAAACIKNLNIIDNVNLVKFAITNIVPPAIGLTQSVIVSPDAGAMKKIYHVAEGIGYKNNILIASKHRDVETGRILRTDVPLTPEHSNKSFVIIDDICDGGRTFIEIAKVIIETYPDARIYLVVTHGIFSASFETLSEYFDGIYCTNSVKDIPKLVLNENEFVKTKVTQYNVF